MHKALQLHRLQTTEVEIDEVEHRLEEIQSSLEGNEQLRQARRTAEETETEWRRWQAKLRDLELETEGLTEKIEAVKKRLYGGRVSNPKELSALQEEVVYLERRKERLEDETLEAMIAVEEKEGKLAEQKEELNRLEADWRRNRERLVAEREELEAGLNRLEAEQAKFRQEIAADDLALYEDLRRRKGGQAVALLEDRLCGGCGVTLPSGKAQQARRGEGLIFCDSCGRILCAK